MARSGTAWHTVNSSYEMHTYLNHAGLDVAHLPALIRRLEQVAIHLGDEPAMAAHCLLQPAPHACMKLLVRAANNAAK